MLAEEIHHARFDLVIAQRVVHENSFVRAREYANPNSSQIPITLLVDLRTEA
jgi:hypothetical protein